MAAEAQSTEERYSGTFEWSETLNARIGSGGDRSTSDRTVNISMVITDGQVLCYGSVNETSQRWSSGRLEEDRLARGDMAGAGLISIEFGEGGIHSGGGETVTTPAEAARSGSSWEIQTYDWLGDFSRPELKGSTTWDHPDADAVNGVTGSVTVKWNLVKRTP
jgi:hypothetical protein